MPFCSPALFCLFPPTYCDSDFPWTVFRQRAYIHKLPVLRTDPDCTLTTVLITDFLPMLSPTTPSTSMGKKKVVSPDSKPAILDEVRQNMEKTDIAQKYEIAQLALLTVLKNASKIDAVLDNNTGSEE